jgi:hypothetical protein
MNTLDDLFKEARSAGPVPSADLMERVMSDAVAVQPKAFHAPKMHPKPAPERGWLDRLVDLFGGAGPVTGGVLAGFAGLAIGYLQPEGLVNLTDTVLATTSTTVSMDLMPGLDSLLTEE